MLDISGSGLSRTVTAQLTNTGTADATNVVARVEVFSGGALEKIHGKPAEVVMVGTLPAGQTVQRQVPLSFGLLDGFRITRQGAKVVVTVLSDQARKTFETEYRP